MVRKKDIYLLKVGCTFVHKKSCNAKEHGKDLRVIINGIFLGQPITSFNAFPFYSLASLAPFLVGWAFNLIQSQSFEPAQLYYKNQGRGMMLQLQERTHAQMNPQTD